MGKNAGISIGEKEVSLEVIAFPSNKREIRGFAWSDIVSVKVIKGTKNTLFIKKPFEHILVQTTNPETPQYRLPIVIEKETDKDSFEEYVNTFKEYSKKRAFRFEDKR